MRIDYIDALRGLAILGVFLTHARLDQLAQEGVLPLVFSLRMGVDLFFLLSGYTLTMMYDARKREESAAAFLIRRFFRVAPLYYLAILVYALVPVSMAAPTGWKDIAANLLFVHTWAPSSINSVVPGGWSIGAEAMYYLLFALMIPFIDSARKAMIIFVLSLLAEAVTAQVHFIYSVAFIDSAFVGTFKKSLPAFFALWAPRHLPLFVAGIWVYFLAKQVKPSREWGLMCQVVALALFVLASYGLEQPYDKPVAMPIYTLVFGLMVVGLRMAPLGLWVNRPLVYLGKVSYSVYIWHFLLLGWAFEWSETYDLPPYVAILVAAVASVALAALSWRFVERFFIEKGRIVARYVA